MRTLPLVLSLAFSTALLAQTQTYDDFAGSGRMSLKWGGTDPAIFSQAGGLLRVRSNNQAINMDVHSGA